LLGQGPEIWLKQARVLCDNAGPLIRDGRAGANVGLWHKQMSAAGRWIASTSA